MTQLPPEVHHLIDAALTEDQVFNDPTTNALVPPEVQAVGIIRTKGNGVLAGVDVAMAVFRRVDATLETREHVPSRPFTGASLAPHLDASRLGRNSQPVSFRSQRKLVSICGFRFEDIGILPCCAVPSMHLPTEFQDSEQV